VAGTFFLYGNLYFAVTGLLPVFLIDQYGLSTAAIAPLTAAVIFCNGAGNLTAGYLLRRGFAFDRIIAWAFGLAVVASTLIFVGLGGAVPVMIVACIAMGISGLVPASVMSSAPTIARDMGHVGAMIGLFMQGSTLGQFTGPPVMAFIAERAGWPVAALFIASLGIGAIGFITLLRRRGRCSRPSASPADRVDYEAGRETKVTRCPGLPILTANRRKCTAGPQGRAVRSCRFPSPGSRAFRE
jgi:MFS family permease